MKYLVLLILPTLLFATFSSDDVGRQIIGLQDKPLRGIVTGSVYTIIEVENSSHAKINSEGSGKIMSAHEDEQWSFFETNIIDGYEGTLLHSTFEDIDIDPYYLVNLSNLRTHDTTRSHLLKLTCRVNKKIFYNESNSTYYHHLILNDITINLAFTYKPQRMHPNYRAFFNNNLTTPFDSNFTSSQVDWSQWFQYLSDFTFYIDIYNSNESKRFTLTDSNFNRSTQTWENGSGINRPHFTKVVTSNNQIDLDNLHLTIPTPYINFGYKMQTIWSPSEPIYGISGNTNSSYDYRITRFSVPSHRVNSHTTTWYRTNLW